jgi:4-hydroxybenzoate polyprenyltransferase
LPFVYFPLNIIKWILYTSLFAALCAVGLCMASEKLILGHLPEIGNPLHLFVLVNTLCIYNLHYYLKKPGGHSDRARWSQAHRRQHLYLIGISASISFFLLFVLPFPVLACSALLGLLSLAYSIPFLPFPNKKRLRDWGILKLLLLVTVWTGVTVSMPLLYWNKPWEPFKVEFMLRFVFMMPLCIAFDIRDCETDSAQNVVTLPNAIGLENSYRTMYGSLLAFVILAVWQYTRYPAAEGRLPGAFITALMAAVIFALVRVRRSDVFFLLLVDGLMLVYSTFIFLL